MIFHVDVNSAFLSWSAIYRLSQGSDQDLRLIPSAIGGDEKSRHGIVLAKSTPAKVYKIVTGEPLANARKKCPELLVVSPDFSCYVKYSAKLMNILKEYTEKVQQYSIDEAFMDMAGTENLYGDPVEFANQLRERIKNELGFTVNVGISTNKLLAKMASDFEKPDKVHTLYPEEISVKMWPLPVEELFFVGKATSAKLHNMGIHTIGELAHMDLQIMKSHLKKQGEVIWNFANGRAASSMFENRTERKGYGNSTTLAQDVTDAETAKLILLSLTETVAARLRAAGKKAVCIAVQVTTAEFQDMSHQMTLPSATDATAELYQSVCSLFDELWKQEPLRLLGVTASKTEEETYHQYGLFDDQYEKHTKLDQAIDQIRGKFGEDSVMRACFLGSGQKHMTGGINKVKRQKNQEKKD